MENGFTIRAILAGIIVLIMLVQARQARAGSHRRRAFALAASGLSVFLLIHILMALGQAVEPLLTILIALAMVLLLSSLVFLALGWRRGEMREKIEQMRQAFATERTRREQELEEKQR